MADNAIARLQAAWVDWVPDEGDLEVVQIEALAQMAADTAEVAAIMPPAAFEAIMELFGVTREEGAPAIGTVTFNLSDDLPHLIGAGTEIDIDGWTFTTDDDVTTSGLSTPGVPVSCDTATADANGLIGDNVAMLTALAFIDSVSLDAPTGGGTDPESDDDYLDKGSRTLELQALTLVTGRDYELMALTQPHVQRVSVASNLPTRQVVVTASAADGTPLSPTDKTNLAALYNEYRQTTWAVSLTDPVLTTISVDFEVHVYPGYVVEGVLAEAAAQVAAFLSAERWNVPVFVSDPTSTWAIEPYVRRNKVVDMIGNAHGVDYVGNVSISGSAGSLQPNGDWLMPGNVPLPVAGDIEGTAI